MHGAFNYWWITIVLDTHKGSCITFLLWGLLNYLLRLTLDFVTFAFFGIALLDCFFRLWPSKSNASLPAAKLLVFTLDSGILIKGAITLLNHRFISTVFNCGDFQELSRLS